MLFFAFFNALGPEQCAICRLSVDGVKRFFANFFYERVNDPWIRDDFIGARGFCTTHAWQMTGIIDSATGVAIIYRHLMEEFCAAFVRATSQQPVGTGARLWRPWAATPSQDAARDVQGWLRPQKPCLACADQWGAEDRYVWTAAGALSDLDLRARYEASLGLCVRHLTAVIEQIRRPDDFEWLVQTERQMMEKLIFDLSEFWRKHDYRFRHEPMGEEKTSSRRVLHKMTGAAEMVWRR